RQTVGRFVRLAHRILDLAEFDARQDRPKDLFASDGHVVAHAVKNGWLDKKALAVAHTDPLAAGDEPGALALSLFDVTQDDLHLPLTDQRAEARLGIERVSRLELLRALDQPPHEVIVDLLFDKEPRARRTDFALAVKDADRRAADGSLEIGIRKHD